MSKNRKKYAMGGPVDNITELYPDILKAVIQSTSLPLDEIDQVQSPLKQRNLLELDLSFLDRPVKQKIKDVPSQIPKVEKVEKIDEEEEIEDLLGEGNGRTKRQKKNWLNNRTNPNVPSPSSSGASQSYTGVGALASDLKKYYDKQGVPSHLSSGLIANFQAESSLDPKVSNKSSNAFGLGQWLGSRKKALSSYAKKQGKAIDDPYLQADFALHELRTTHKDAYDAAMKTSDPSEAAIILMNKYEKPSEEEKMKSSNKRRKAADEVSKYLEGGTVNSVGSSIGGYANIAGAALDGVFKMIDAFSNNPNAYSDQPIMNIKQASQMTSPYSKGFQFATGGITPKVPVEVEDDEVAETPNGEIMQFDGATHANGGIDVNLPGGTKIYSDKLKLNGKTMQERKLAREKAEAKIQKILDNNPSDAIARQGMERLRQVNMLEDTADMVMQETARQKKDNPKFATGGVVYNPRTGMFEEQPTVDSGVPFANNVVGSNQYTGNLPNLPINGQAIDYQGNTPDNWTSEFMNPQSGNVNIGTVPNTSTPNTSVTTVGDIIGMGAGLAGSIAPLLNSGSDQGRPNENFYKNFGQDALDTNQSAQGYVDSQRANQLTALNTQKNAAKLSSRNSAGNINTLRALDLLSNKQADMSANNINNSFSQQMMGLLGQRSALQNQRDQFVMSGEHQADIANRQDAGVGATNRGRDINTLFGGIQQFARQLNQVDQKQTQMDIMPDLSKYGLGYARDENGKLVLTKLR